MEPKTINEKAGDDWQLARVTCSGFNEKSYGIRNATRGDLFWGPERFVKELAQHGRAARVPEYTEALDVKPVAPSKTKPAGPSKRKPARAKKTKKG